MVNWPPANRHTLGSSRNIAPASKDQSAGLSLVTKSVFYVLLTVRPGTALGK